MKNKVCILLMATVLGVSSCKSDIAVGVVDTQEYCSNGTLRVVGSGPVITETLPLGNFKRVVNLQGVDVNISQGSEQVVTATGHANVIRKLELAIGHGSWTIALEEGCYSDFTLTLDITLPELEQVVSKSSGDITLEGFDGIEDLEIISWGSGDIRAISEFGALRQLRIDSRGGGDLSLYQILAEDCTVFSAGSGKCAVQVQNSLDVTIKGSGNVTYRGHPSITQQLIGSGRVLDDN